MKKNNCNNICIWLSEAAISAIIAICLLCGITFIYNFTGIHITNETGATDYKWEPSQWKSTMSEGFAWLHMDGEGFNNVNASKRDKVDILLMGSSHMEGLEVATNENTGALLNEMLPDYNTYNIGMSGHTIFTCVKNMDAAISEYMPEEYIVLETDRVDLSLYDMKQVIDGTYKTIPSYDSGILYIVQKYVPAAKLIYGRLEEWISASSLKDHVVEAQEPPLPEEEYYNTLIHFLDKANDAVGRSKARLIIFYQPTTELNEQGRFVSSTDVDKLALFEKACNETGILFVDMTKPFEQLYTEKNILAHGFTNTAVGVGHLNREGHRVIAEVVAQIIKGEEVKESDPQ